MRYNRTPLVQTLHAVYILEQFKQFCSNRFIEKTLIPPTTMGRVCVQRVALYESARAARAIKREAGGFRLRDAMRACGALACAQRARGARRRPRPHFTAVRLLVHKWGLLTASVLVTLLQGGSDQDIVQS